MSGPSFQEMEAKRLEMIASFRDIAAAMTRCVTIIEDYTRLAPSINVPNIAPDMATVNALANSIGHTLPAASTAMLPVEPEKKQRKPKEKKIKDPNAPKRPPSAYILYQNDVRDSMKAQNPGASYQEILAIISERWKALPDSAKKEYENAYQHAHAAYKQEDNAYKSGKPFSAPAPPVPAAVSDSSSESDSDDSDDSDEEVAPTLQQPYPTQPYGSNSITPAVLQAANAAVAANALTPAKKEKKRKNKAEEAQVDSSLVAPEAEKKKKKKSKKDA